MSEVGKSESYKDRVIATAVLVGVRIEPFPDGAIRALHYVLPDGRESGGVYLDRYRAAEDALSALGIAY